MLCAIRSCPAVGYQGELHGGVAFELDLEGQVGLELLELREVDLPEGGSKV